MKHGGDLSQARQAFDAGGEGWLDLSTGINPLAYPSTPPSAESWERLPQSGALAGLIEAARMAYGASNDAAIAAAPGTQMLIQLLPLFYPAKSVAIVGPTYNEHALCWRMAGAEVAMIDDPGGFSPSPGMLTHSALSRRGRGQTRGKLGAQPSPLANLYGERQALTSGEGGASAPGEGGKPYFADVFKCYDALVVVNPNNPDGRSWTPEHVLQCADEMARHGGLLIVDEAFADVQPEVSVVPHAGRDGLIVLRSFGKFFGLAGVRLGFAIGAERLIALLKELLGPWGVSGPAIEIGTQALQDLDWQGRTRKTCAEMAAKLDVLLIDAGFEIIGGTPLFRLTHHEHAQNIHRGLARQGIWVRRFDDHSDLLRFGLPGDDAAFRRLAAALCM